MALFPRFTQEFSPLFRLFDDYERQFQNFDSRMRSFSPKFDVKETKDAYELKGEFPGIEQKDINIEWTDANTLSIHGRHEEVKEKGQRPQGFIEEPGKKDKEHQPRVEDEGEQTQVATKGNQEVAQKNDNEPKYWVSERSVGEFHRSFAFPNAVDQDAVKASLKNGILSIVVPKSKAPQPRRVKIE
jgi:HSP20 family molecular chaperone IbpA